MYNICVFGGTTEGRELVEFLSAQPCNVTACVVTDYAQSLLPASGHVTVSAKKLPADEIAALLQTQRFDLVVDATHPYAQSITKSIARACRETGTQYVRLLRKPSAVSPDALYFETTEEAISFLRRTSGRILLTTGSKELSQYAAIEDFSNRVWARVLPLTSSLDACQKAGLPPAHIFAMQGPFSAAMNATMLQSITAAFLVTKDGGAPGGFEEKAAGAKQAGAKLVVIGRPPEADAGLSLEETISTLCSRFGFPRTPEVFLAGIGPGSERFQLPAIRETIQKSDCLIGAQRMLDAVARPGQQTCDAIAPENIASAVRAHPECRTFTVVLSGDTGFFSGAKKLLPLLSGCKVTVLPGISSMSYLCAKLGASYDDAAIVSLHGRTTDIARAVRANRKVFALVGGPNGMQALCARLVDAGLSQVRVSVGERLSYPDEKITCGTARELSEQTFDKLSVALIENDHPDAIVTHGLPDEAFLRSLEPGKLVPMTKSEVRSVCLSKLQLTQDAVCWDVGAGTGSVSIEMAIQASRGRVYAIEKNEQALALLQENKTRFSQENLDIVPGAAPQACEALPAPTHVFLGGTSGNLPEILALILHKNPHARIVATAVTLESAAALTGCMKNFKSADCISMQVSKASAAGSYHLMKAQNPVWIFTLQNGGACS